MHILSVLIRAVVKRGDSYIVLVDCNTVAAKFTSNGGWPFASLLRCLSAHRELTRAAQ